MTLRIYFQTLIYKGSQPLKNIYSFNDKRTLRNLNVNDAGQYAGEVAKEGGVGHHHLKLGQSLAGHADRHI